MNYKVIRDNTDFNLKVGDIIDRRNQYIYDVYRGSKIVDNWNKMYIALLHEAGYLKPISPELKLEVILKKNNTWEFIHNDNIFYLGSDTSLCHHLDQLLAERDGENG